MLTRDENQLLTSSGRGTPVGELWRRFWNPFLLSSELPAADCPPLRVRLLGEDLVAFRDTSGTVGLLGANCPHRGASLFFGRNEEQGLRCVYHGWKYDVSGACVDMPNEPAESNFKHKINHTGYPCQEAGGLIWTYMGPKELQPAMPELEWLLVPDSHPYISKMSVESNWVQALEGDIDNSHAAFAHGLFGCSTGDPFIDRVHAAGALRNQQQQPNMAGLQTAFLTSSDITPIGSVRDTDYGVIMGWRRNADDQYYWRTNHWMVPSHVMLASPPGNTLLCNTRVPIDDDNSWQFRVSWNAERPLTEQELALRGGRTSQVGGGSYPELIPGRSDPWQTRTMTTSSLASSRGLSPSQASSRLFNRTGR